MQGVQCTRAHCNLVTPLGQWSFPASLRFGGENIHWSLRGTLECCFLFVQPCIRFSTARRLYKAQARCGLCYARDVCSSVRLSQASVLSKQLNEWSTIKDHAWLTIITALYWKLGISKTRLLSSSGTSVNPICSVWPSHVYHSERPSVFTTQLRLVQYISVTNRQT